MLKSKKSMTLGDKSRCLKFTIVGDTNTGKTSLLQTYITKTFPEEYTPTVFDTHHVNIQVDNEVFPVALHDTSGVQEYTKLRPLSYPKTDCFLVCYSVDNPATFTNLKCAWIPEVRKHCPNAAVMLVGNKMDLITPDTEPPIQVNEVKKFKSRINAQAFIECSAITQENVDYLFIEAVKISVAWNSNSKNSKIRQCVVT